ncbi:AAA family ATPase [Shouchella shacheensis]|uniref:AAA family ATPase n=1 Tax=Shouchella shacheensis TaxID=1649580 RepID=UPI00073FE390|nr:AAA family ATPase [Shouchella shacheensis]
MSNIRTVRLENFQSHFDTTLTLDDGLNVLIGQSDSGKTAVLRGVRWVLFNQPRGTDFIRVGADFVRVTVTFASGVAIVRERTSSKNRYIVKKLDQEDLVLEGFGIHVPEEVLDAHGMRGFRIDGDNEWHLQVAQQLDGPFLLEQTASLRAKTIGRMSGAHYLDMAIRDTSRDLLSVHQRMKHKEQEANEVSEALKPFRHLHEAKKKIDRGVSALEKAREKQAKLDRLKRAAQRYRALEAERAQTQNQLQLIEGLSIWQELYEKTSQDLLHHQKLNHAKKQLASYEKDLHTCQSWMEKTKTIHEAGEGFHHVSRISERLKRLARLQQEANRQAEMEKKVEQALSQTNFVTVLSGEQLAKIKEQQQRKQQLMQAKERFLAIKRERKRIETDVTVGTRAEKAKAYMESAIHSKERLRTLQDMGQKLEEMQKRLREGKAFVEKQEEQEETLKNQQEEQLKKMSICPTCGQAIHA